MTILRVGSEFVVNTATANSQNDSHVTVLTDGRFVVTYTDPSVSGGDLSFNAIRARIFNANGTQAAPEFLVNTITAGNQLQSSIAALSNGGFVVTFNDDSGLGGDNSVSSIRARIFNANGTQAAPELLVNTTISGFQGYSSVAALANGGFVVSFTDESGLGGDNSASSIRARIFNATGGQTAPEFIVNTATTDRQDESSVTALADGRFVVTYSDLSLSVGDTSSRAVRARIFNANGSESIPEFLVNTTVSNQQLQSEVAALADGRFVVTFSDFSQNGGDILARIFNGNGTQSVAEFRVNTTTTGSQNLSAVTALADGRILFTWTDSSLSSDDPNFNAIRARIVNSDGTASIPEFLVNTTIASTQVDSSVAALPDGRFIVTWTDFSATGADTSGSAIRAQIFDPRLYDGTPAAETVTGGSFNDTINGLGGADSLSGRGGDDFLSGGDGADTVSGDDGNDTLDGGVGADLIDGGAGLDFATYSAASGGVTARLDFASLNTGEAAGDTYTSIEGLIGSTFNDYLVGTDTAGDYLTSQGGDDYIAGRGGNDTILGDDGLDQFWGGEGADALDGGAGYDIARYDFAATGLVVRLDGGANSGEATGDTFTGIEALYGSAFGDYLIGDNLGNVLCGLDGGDLLYGLGGDDLLLGGGGIDAFAFNNAGFGTDTVLDFNTTAATGAAHDYIDFRGIPTLSSFSITQVGANTHVVTNHGTVVLQGITAATLVAGDFLF
jgi:Ca2+-binding RTX toxin-like protein